MLRNARCCPIPSNFVPRTYVQHLEEQISHLEERTCYCDTNRTGLSSLGAKVAEEAQRQDSLQAPNFCTCMRRCNSYQDKWSPVYPCCCICNDSCMREIPCLQHPTLMELCPWNTLPPCPQLSINCNSALCSCTTKRKSLGSLFVHTSGGQIKPAAIHPNLLTSRHYFLSSGSTVMFYKVLQAAQHQARE